MDNISLKLDTLCNLTSLAVSSYTAANKPKQAEPLKPASLRTEKEPVEEALEEASNRPEFWNFPVATREPGGRGTHAPGDTPLHKPLEFVQNPEKGVEIYSQDHTKEGTKEPDGLPLQKDVAPGNSHSDAPDAAHHGGVGNQVLIQDEEPLPEFPAKVSEIVFADESEARVRDALGAAHSIEAQELTLELTTVEELTAEITEGLAVSERVLLMAQPTNGAGASDVTYDGLAPELHAELSYEEPNEAPSQPAGDSVLKDVPSEDRELAVSTEEPLAETAGVQPSAEALSVQKVIDDITSIKEPAKPKAESEPAGTVAELEVAPSTAPVMAETVAQPETAAAETVFVQPVEITAEPSPVEETKTVSEEPEVAILEEAIIVKEEAEAPTAVHAEGAPVAELPSAVDAAGLDSLPTKGDIEVSFEEIPKPDEEAASSTDPSSWAPIDLVEAKGNAVLGIDFGASLSKVALKTDESAPATAVPVALIAYEILHKADLMSHFESQSEYVEDSLIYFDQNEFVFCGSLAKKLSLEAAEAGQSRPAIQNLKTFLVRGGGKFADT